MTRRVLPSPIARPTRAVRYGWAPESSSPLTAMICVRSSTDSSETEKLMGAPPVDVVVHQQEGYPFSGSGVRRRLVVDRLHRRGSHGSYSEARAVPGSPEGLVA